MHLLQQPIAEPTMRDHCTLGVAKTVAQSQNREIQSSNQPDERKYTTMYTSPPYIFMHDDWLQNWDLMHRAGAAWDKIAWAQGIVRSAP